MKRPGVTDEAIERAIANGAKVLGVRLPGAEGKPRRSKYNAKPKSYRGVRYASGAEADWAATLDGHVAARLVLWWIGQPTFRLGCPENIYKPDFLIVAPDGVYVVDVKGVETAKFKKDKRLWKAYGPCPLHIIKGSKTVEIIRPGDTKEE